MNLSRSLGLLSVAALLTLTACPREEPEYPAPPQQQYPQQQYPQQYPQQPQPAYTQPAPAYTQPAPQPAPGATAGQPASVIPGVMKMPDGTCQFTPPSLDPNTPAQPVAVPCPPM